LHIAGEEQGAAAFGFNGRFGGVRIRLFDRQVHDRDIGAFARKEEGDRAADTRVASGNERHQALQLVGAAVRRRMELWSWADV